MTAGDGSGPGLDIQLLAELEADGPDGAGAARLRAAVDADPAAAAALAALASTRAELAALSMPPMPPGAADRWAAALQAEADRDRATGAPAAPYRAPATGTRADRPADRTRRRPRVVRGRPRSRAAQHSRARVAVAAAALLVLLTTGLLWSRPSPPDRVDLAAAGRSAIGHSDLGPFADPARRAGCLRALGVLGLDPDATPLGGRRVDLARGPGMLLVFVTGELGVFDVVVVDPACGPAGGTLLGTARVGQ